MEFGLYAPLPHIHMPEEFTPRFEGDSPFRIAVDAVAAADRQGFFITLVAQRYLGPDLEAWVLSGALAHATSRIQVMPAFHPTMWSPAVLAKMCATLDQMTGGRAALNLVTGWWKEEHQMFGGASLEDDARYARAEEFVTVMRRLWTEPSVTFKGEHFDLDKAELPLKPVRVTPPIYGAARSERGLDMVARSCDWWFVPYPNDFRTADANIEALSRGVRAMTERAARFGRQLRYAANAFVIHDENEAAALALAEEVERHGQTGEINRIHAHGLGLGLIGSRDRILDRIARIREQGVEMLLLKFLRVEEGVNRFGEEIMSRLPKTAAVA